MVKVELKKINLKKDGMNSVMSPLQSHILEILWKKNNLKVRQIHDKLKSKGFALTSIAVDLDRLYKIGLVDRRVGTALGGPHYVYNVRKTKKEFQKSVLENTVDRLMHNFGKVAIDYFNERFSSRGKK